MPRPPNSPRDPRDSRDPRENRRPVESRPPAGSRPPLPSRTPAPLAVKSGIPHGATEAGWLPDLIFTGEKFEAGLAFFADTHGKITRFSREPADLALARRLEGQVVLPGLVNAHSHAFERVVRGRVERPGSGALSHALTRLTEEDVFDASRLAFLEMLLAGITCVGEFHYLHQQPDGTPFPDVHALARQVVRAAQDVGLRIVLLRVACLRGGFRGEAASAPPRLRAASAESFCRDTEQLRAALEKEFPVDEVALGVGLQSLAHVPLDAVKTIATYARSQRLRLQAHVGGTAEEVAGCVAEYGRPPVSLLAEHGFVDKRFTAVEANHLSEDEVKALGGARAMVCVCPGTDLAQGRGPGPVDALLAAGATLALGTDGHRQIDLLKDARQLEYVRRSRVGKGGPETEGAATWFHAATVGGARSLGANTGALEVGRAADFFTVGLHDPSIAGADPETLLLHVVFGLERRAIRDVWVGGRQRIAHGRHVAHGPIVGRFVDLQKRLWAGPA